jgi:lipoyl(octanoyl) transferase
MALRIVELGRMSYEAALVEQQRVHAEVLAGDAPPTVLMVEHHPVITIGRHPGSAQHLVADASLLARQGVEVCMTDRGGDITYHGPGQLVAYPIVPLNDLGLNVRRYVWTLEQAIIETVADFGIVGHRDQCAIGVWVGGQATSQMPDVPEQRCGCGGAKLAAIGVRVRKWITMHGLALNVGTNLDHFKLIVPCGLADRPVTSMRQLLGEQCPPMSRVKASLGESLMRHLGSIG